MAIPTVEHDTRSRVDVEARRLLASLGAAPSFDSAGLDLAVAAFPAPRTPGQLAYAAPGLGWREGFTFRLVVGPGMAQVSSFNVANRDRAVDRVREAGHRTAAFRGASALGVEHVVRVGSLLCTADPDTFAGQATPRPLPPLTDGVPAGVVTQWSRKSRNRMLRGFASVDWSELGLRGLPLAMVTLTYPGAWESVAPSGKVAKRHLAALRGRFRRAFGFRWDGAWKLEFQRRGAPHFHLLVPVPAVGPGGGRFEDWLSLAWAQVVAAKGAEFDRHVAAGTNVDFSKVGRMSDPKRLAVYFLKHGSKSLDDKEYQHFVPALWQLPGMGPGRFWGFWGLKPATIALDLDMADWVTVRRVLRKVMRARARRGGKAPARTLGRGGQLTGGWVLVNDGVRLAGDLARAVNLSRMGGQHPSTGILSSGSMMVGPPAGSLP